MRGGMPVKRQLSKGVRAPMMKPGKLPKSIPPIKTGRCMGRKVRPPIPKVWKARGSNNPQAINNEVKISLLVRNKIKLLL